MINLTKDILTKYDVEGPRYTSYPTAPVWTSAFTSATYTDILSNLGKNNDSISLYIHIPFCSKRCLYCACNVVIRKDHEKAGTTYLNYIEKELSLIVRHTQSKPKIKQIHIGGGTPTFLSDEQLSRLISMIESYLDTSEVEEQSIELDPRTMSPERLTHIRRLGFDRISFGIQDFDETVQDDIGRHQSFDMVEQLITHARALKFSSINCDIIYGLPKQTMDRFKNTISKLIQLKPDRIALYSFAFVPWIHEHQKALTLESSPSSDEKMALFLYARKTLLSADYESIAMDHFALKTDALAIAYANNSLHRTFMGYTTLATPFYLGVGVSSIGYVNDAFIQHTKDLKKYYESLDKNIFPVEKGYSLSERDIINQWIIRTLMCQFTLDKTRFEQLFDQKFDDYTTELKPHLLQCEEDGLIHHHSERLEVTELGRLFVRNICMGFDDYLPSIKKGFSKTI